MKVRILRSAVEDLASARQFYDQQQIGIGAYFFSCLMADIESLVLYGGIHRVQHGFHRMLAKRFPYGIYYQVIRGEIVVFRVLDCRRHPDWIRRNLG